MAVSSIQTTKKPLWLKVKLPTHENYFYVSQLLKKHDLHTICQSAKCPNISECWAHKTATFLILGDTCTRACAFCAVTKGKPSPPPKGEPERVAEAISDMNLHYVVITSVTRDDLPDGGASQFASTLKAVRQQNPGIRVEVLIPDFNGDAEALKTVIAAAPDVVNHNIEAPENIYPLINRPVQNYRRSLKILKKAKELGATIKSGLMIGLGEKKQDIFQTFADLKAVSCDLLTIGQYLQPSRFNPPTRKYYTPEEFVELKKIALKYGFSEVESGPLVRSSYGAHGMYKQLKRTC
ncbi:MAG: lipoyl synthase [Candidatus Aminicenantaceae bacterium]